MDIYASPKIAVFLIRVVRRKPRDLVKTLFLATAYCGYLVKSKDKTVVLDRLLKLVMIQLLRHIRPIAACHPE